MTGGGDVFFFSCFSWHIKHFQWTHFTDGFHRWADWGLKRGTVMRNGSCSIVFLSLRILFLAARPKSALSPGTSRGSVSSTLWQVSKPHPRALSGPREINHHMYLLLDLCFVWRWYIIWHNHPAHYYGTQMHLNVQVYVAFLPRSQIKTLLKKASSSVSPLFSLQIPLFIFTCMCIYMHMHLHVFNKVTFIHASRVHEHVIKPDQNNKRTHIFKGWEGQKHGKKKTPLWVTNSTFPSVHSGRLNFSGIWLPIKFCLVF